MRSSGVTLKEIQRAMDVIQNQKDCNQIVLDKEMLEQMRYLISSGIEQAKILQQRIDKTIDYFEQPAYKGYLLAGIGTHYFKLLEILKGENE